LPFRDARGNFTPADRRRDPMGAAMTCRLILPGHAGKRPKAIHAVKSGPANRGNLLLFPAGQRLKAVIPEQGDDAGRCSSKFSAKNYREATSGERATHRKWVLGIVVFCCAVLLISGVVATMVDSSSGLTGLTTLSAPATARPARSN
jgi:hypothetical protein